MLTLVIGCSDSHPTSPTADWLAPLVIVSAPTAQSSLPSKASTGVRTVRAAVGNANTAAAVYVSLPPHSAPGVSTARVRNRRTGESVVIAMINDGFDPVPIAAGVGDDLTIELGDSTSATSSTTVRVPPRRPPRIVRTDPPNGKTDVPLNSQILVVFSEPVDPGTAATAVQLTNGSQTVAGIAALSSSGIVAEFLPNAALAASTKYTLIVTTALRDLVGDALEQGTRIDFTTAAALVSSPSKGQCFPNTGQPSGLFSSVGNMAVPRLGVSSILLPDGRVVVYGGTAVGAAGPKAEVFDPATQTFSPADGMLTVVGPYPAVALPEGKLLFFDGLVLQDGRVFFPAPSGAVIYDPLSRTYGPTGSYTHTHVLMWSTRTLLLDGRVLITGAEHWSDGLLTGAAELFDPKTGTFKETGPMQAYSDTPGWGTLLTDGTVLFVQWNWNAMNDDIELYDPATEAFSRIGSVCGDNNLSAAVRLHDGTVLITGGQLPGGNGTTQTLLYLPALRSFVDGPALVTRRHSHSATLLLDGRVLIAGGYSIWLYPPQPTAGAEIYTPIR